jgi:arginyl-tRNA synthetase
MSHNPYKSVEQQLSDWIRKGIQSLWPDQNLSEAPLYVTPTADNTFGDFQCNAAMSMAKILKSNPRQIAEQVAAGLDLHPALAKMDIAGPGFINLFLDDAWLAGFLIGLEGHDHLGVPQSGDGQTILMDYSSPNIAKPMHIAHIRSTVIGNALDRMYRFLGYQVISDNHLGDWGTQFGLIILGYRNFLDADAYAASPVEELERVYVQSYEKAEAEPAWREEAKRELVKLQQGDAENRALWEEFVRISLQEFAKVYERLDVQFDLYRGESYYNDQLPGVLEALSNAGLLEKSEGAQIVRLDEEKLPVCIVQKSDGGFNYATSDLATVQSRIQEFSADGIVYITDERQQLHFKQFFAIAHRLGWKANLEHVWFGLMRLPEGTFSTRQGNVIKLEALLDEAVIRALQLVQDSSPEMPADQQQAVAEMVGIGAIKYADLSQNPQSLVTFTWDKAMALDGNSAPYLQYAHARICSVLDKFKEQFPEQDLDVYPIELTEPQERDLAIRITRFAEAVTGAAEQHRPNLLCDYLYQLSQAYSSFYQNLPFLKAEEGVRESRIRLGRSTARVLRQGLDLLGIGAPERI